MQTVENQYNFFSNCRTWVNVPSQCHVIARHAKSKPTAMTVAQRFRMFHAA
jgi:hypothetical protein